MNKYPDYLDESGNYKQFSLLHSAQTTSSGGTGTPTKCGADCRFHIKGNCTIQRPPYCIRHNVGGFLDMCKPIER